MDKYADMSDEEIREMVAEAFGDKFQKESDEIRKELSSESPRASVLVGAAWIDEYLFDYIETALPDDEKLKQVFLSPLRYFGHRIKVAHKLGIIGDNERATLDVIKDIRNKFAHRTSVSFEDEDVVQLIDRLEPYSPPGYSQMRDISNDASKYVSVVSYYVASLFVRIRNAIKYEDLETRLGLLRYIASESDKKSDSTKED